MLSTRGDAHKIYKKVRLAKKEKRPLKSLKELKELYNIQTFYEQIETDELVLIKYQMEKEKNGSGMLPILVSSLPWIFFIFSKQLQDWLLNQDSYLYLGLFVFMYISFILFSVVIHFREKAWASVHTKILTNVIDSRFKNQHLGQ